MKRSSHNKEDRNRTSLCASYAKSQRNEYMYVEIRRRRKLPRDIRSFATGLPRRSMCGTFNWQLFVEAARPTP